MTYDPRQPWITLDDLLSLERKDRVRYVRQNLPGRSGRKRPPHMTLDEFADAVGAKNRQAPINWEAGRTPRDYALKIAALTPYPPEAFGAPGEAELLRQTYGRRLRELETTVEALERDGESFAGEVVVRLAALEAAAGIATPPGSRQTSTEHPE